MITDRWERVFRLFDAALAVPVWERATFLAAECAGDPTLREEVQSLLDAEVWLPVFCPGSLVRLAGLTGHRSDARIRDVYPRHPRWRLSDRVVYRRRRDGRGVPRARHAARSHRRHQGAAAPRAARDPDLATRFEREARAISQLSHPQHLHAARRRPARGRRLPRDGVPRGRDAGRAARARAAAARPRRCASAIEIADALEAAHRARHRAPRSEAGQRHADRRAA